MAIAYVGAGGTEPAGSTSASFSVPLPAGITEGDLILIPYGCTGTWTGDVAADPHPSASGYVRVAESRMSGIGGMLAKIAGPSESDPTIVFPVSVARYMARAVAYRGVDPSFMDAPHLTEGGTGSQRKPPDLRPNADGAVIVAWRAMDNSNNTVSFASGLDQGFTMRVANPVITPARFSLGLADKTISTGGSPETSPTFTQGNTGGSSAFVLSLLPDEADTAAHHRISATGRYTNSTSLTVPVNGPLSGDLILLHTSVNSSVTINTPTGYTEIFNQTESVFTVAIFARKSDGSETDVTVTASGAGDSFSATAFVLGDVKFDDATDIKVDHDYSDTSPLQAPGLTADGEGRALSFARVNGSAPAVTSAQGFWQEWLWAALTFGAGRSELLTERVVSAAGSVTFPTYDSGEDLYLISLLTLTDVPGSLVQVGVATEAETALPVSPVKPITVEVGTVDEAETALPVAAVKPITVQIGQASETELALGVSPTTSRIVEIGSATEAETALPVTPIKPVIVPIGTATEAESALPMSVVQPRIVPVGQAIERELALTVSPRIVVPGKLRPITCQIAEPAASCATAAPTATCSTADPTIACTIEP